MTMTTCWRNRVLVCLAAVVSDVVPRTSVAQSSSKGELSISVEVKVRVSIQITQTCSLYLPIGRCIGLREGQQFLQLSRCGLLMTGAELWWTKEGILRIES